jgi:hypothetical protein
VRRELELATEPKKFGKTSTFDLEACKSLKSHKTSKTFLGKAWHWNHRSLEKLGIGGPKNLEA